jgi:hypothetical protein
MMSKLSAVALILIALSACGEDGPAKSIDRTTDCADICKAYKDCIATDYDVDACVNRCSDMDTVKQSDRIDTCEDCLDDKSCVDSVFSCTTECAGIVP